MNEKVLQELSQDLKNEKILVNCECSEPMKKTEKRKEWEIAAGQSLGC